MMSFDFWKGKYLFYLFSSYVDTYNLKDNILYNYIQLRYIGTLREKITTLETNSRSLDSTTYDYLTNAVDYFIWQQQKCSNKYEFIRIYKWAIQIHILTKQQNSLDLSLTFHFQRKSAIIKIATKSEHQYIGCLATQVHSHTSVHH